MVHKMQTMELGTNVLKKPIISIFKVEIVFWIM
jgi:hypothetical protein